LDGEGEGCREACSEAKAQSLHFGRQVTSAALSFDNDGTSRGVTPD